LPYPNYAAAYLINNTNKTIEFAMFFENLWGSAYIGGFSLAELLLNVEVENGSIGNIFILQPGNKVKVFSAAFNSTNRRIPHSYITGDVIVDGERKTVSAFIANE